MGQATSLDSHGPSKPAGGTLPTKELEMFNKNELTSFFFQKTLISLGPKSCGNIFKKLELSSINQTQIISRDAMAVLFDLPSPVNQDPGYVLAISLLADAFTVLGTFPFLNDVLAGIVTPNGSKLTVKSIYQAIYFFLGRYKQDLPNYDIIKLIFICLTVGMRFPPENQEKKSETVEITRELNETPFVVEIVDPAEYNNNSANNSNSNTTSNTSNIGSEEIADFSASTSDFKDIRWSTFSAILTFDEVDLRSLTIDLKLLVQLFTLLLIVGSEDSNNYKEGVASKIQDWKLFEICALELVRYLNLTSSVERPTAITLQQFRNLLTGFPEFFENGMKRMCNRALISEEERQKQRQLDHEAAVKKEQREREELRLTGSVIKLKKSFAKFEPSRLVNKGSVAILSSLSRITGFQVSEKNLVKLYSGAEAGFSIRSLELKIFKWQAPTIFFISGKRLKKKTMEVNKRYQQFSEEFPRYFRNAEESKKSWQKDNDTITYAVLLKVPWKASNKKNFGDSNTVIVSLSPHVDIFKSSPSTLTKGELIYFNNLGMGIGFGNEQPVNKNGTKRYFPGDTLLTIEANLEFAIFRHISTPTSNTSRYFAKSEQNQLRNEDFEDRFMITDLEVWGLGSNKELDEQRRQWEWENKQAEARQSVNIRNMGEERAFLEMAGLIGNHAAGGSV